MSPCISIFAENYKILKQSKDFRFKQFTIVQHKATHKVGTDGVLLGAWVDVQDTKSILDIGTGSGVIALMLAQRTLENTTIDAVEIQENDALQADENVKNSPWPSKVKIHRTDISDYSPSQVYDLIVSNPPFFKDSYLPPLANRATVRHGHSLTFDTLIVSARRLLRPQGRFAVILPAVEGSEFIHMCALKGLHAIRICEFQSRTNKPIERLMIEFSFEPLPVRKEKLVLYGEGDQWSDEYKTLTCDFYLNI